MTNNIYTLITRGLKKQVRPYSDRCYKNDASHFASKNAEKETATIQKSYVTVAATSFHEMPEDPVNSLLQKLRFLFSSRWGTRLHEHVDQRHKELGPTYRTNMGPAKVVFTKSIYAYSDILLKNAGKYPSHFIPEAWIIYNNEHSKSSRGLFFMEGDEWHKFRKIMEKHISQPKSTDFMIEPCGEVAEDLAKKMSLYAEAGTEVPNLKQHIYEYSLQAILSALMGSSWSTHKIQIRSETSDLASNLYKIFKYSSLLSVISARKAKEWNFPWWKHFVVNLDDIMKKVTNTVLLMTTLESDGLLKKMLDGNMNEKDVVRIVADLIIAAGDTTSSATQWALYSLSQHPEMQEQFYESIKDKNHKEILSVDFVNWFLKETLRMYPTAPFLTRYLPKDAYIDGHYVSKDDLLLLSLYSSGRDPANFIDPDQFQPDRWSRSTKDRRYKGVLHPTATIPFALGVRSCIGKSMANIKIKLALSELVKNFRIECTNKRPVKMVLQMIAEPSEPIQLKLTPR